MNGFVFSDSIIIGHYVGGLGQRCPSSVLYFSDKGNYIDTIPEYHSRIRNRTGWRHQQHFGTQGIRTVRRHYSNTV